MNRNFAPMRGTRQMNGASSVKLQEVTAQGLHVSIEPNPTDPHPGTILDKHGDILTKEAGWMARVDSFASEKVELSKGTILLIGAVPTILFLILSYGGAAIGWARDDQTQKEHLRILQVQLEAVDKKAENLNQKFDEVQKSLQQQALQNAKVEGYKLGQTDAGATGHK